MARGQIAKDAIIAKILANFDGSFINGKEIRIPYVENGELVQIKCALTCAKDNVSQNAAAAVPGAVNAAPQSSAETDNNKTTVVEMTEAEKQNVQYLAQKLIEMGM